MAYGYAAFSVSTTGILAFSPGAPATTRLMWVDRSGRVTDDFAYPGLNGATQLSRDGRQVLLHRFDPERRARDVWIGGTDGRNPVRLTFGPEDNSDPAWSKDEQTVYFGGAVRTKPGIYAVHASGDGVERLLVATPELAYPRSVSSDGRFLLFVTHEPEFDLWAVRVDIDGEKPFPVVTGPRNQVNGMFNPAAGFIAYLSDESGRYEAYVCPFPPDTRKWRVSSDGGTQARWRADGRELYFVAQDGSLQAVPFDPMAPSPVGTPHTLFKSGQVPLNTAQYFPNADASRFFVAAQESVAGPVVVTTNWRASKPF